MGTGRANSDIDIVLLSEEPGRWLDSDNWLPDVTPGAVLMSKRDFGALQERRLRSPAGLEIELGIGRPFWANVTPLDDGTRRVASGGLRPLWDPSGLLYAVLAAIRSNGL